MWLSQLRVPACVSYFQHWVSLSAHRGSTITTSPRSRNGEVTSDVNTTQGPRLGQSASSTTDHRKDGVGEADRSYHRRLYRC